jgi:homogentisate 1,2-dioxygenase
MQSEARPGSLPQHNNPRKAPHGLISELVSGASFGAPRACNVRSYMFRVRPSVTRGVLEEFSLPNFRTPSFGVKPAPNPAGWTHFDEPAGTLDFLEGIHTLCGNGSPQMHAGVAVHAFVANASMGARAFQNADGDTLIVPQRGRLRIATELGVLEIRPSEFAVIPRGIKFRVDLLDPLARGYVLENFGAPLRLPELGLIGAFGQAHAIDFKAPTAAFEEAGETQLVVKYCGGFWAKTLAHTPFDVVAWRGNLVPYKYDMTQFMCIGSLTFDHSDPSVFCAMTSPGDPVLGANFDIGIIPPHWVVGKETFLPPGYHRNICAEFLVLLTAPEGGRVQVASLHNPQVPHGPATSVFERGREQGDDPVWLGDGPQFFIETRFPMEVAPSARECEAYLPDYHEKWSGFRARFAAVQPPSGAL